MNALLQPGTDTKQDVHNSFIQALLERAQNVDHSTDPYEYLLSGEN